MRTILLIRHGATAGNLEKRYIGRTDEPLCALGESQAIALAPSLPQCDTVFSSPLLRCRQTAGILFPERKINIIQDLRECDFGLFEGKNADEMILPIMSGWQQHVLPPFQTVRMYRHLGHEVFGRLQIQLSVCRKTTLCRLCCMEAASWP